MEYLKEIKNKSINLILTDPPYIISKNSGMNKFQKKIEKIEKSGKNCKSEEEWEEYRNKK